MTARLLSLLGRVPPLLADGALATAVLLAQLAPFVSAHPLPGHYAWPLAMFLPVIASAVPLIWRRRAPFVVLILTELGAGAYALFPDGPSQPIWYGALVAMFTLAAQARQWQRSSALALIGGGAIFVTSAVDTAARGVLLWLTAYALGRAWAARGAQSEALRQQAQHLEKERELAAAQERARVARDMHDILAHGVSVMIAQAEAGPVFIGKDDAKVEASFDAITAAGREAMTQLRRILGVLREPGGTAPQPTLSDIAPLVAQVAESGVRVTLTESGQPATLAADAQVAAYRIVQESLTNVLKHARGVVHPVEVDVDLDGHAAAMVLTITDNGPGGFPAEAGRGLIGIAERAIACGGSAECGPRADASGFRVSARLPIESVPALAGAE